MKKLTKADAERLKKTMAAALDKCWDAEDTLRESLAKAREGGIKSKKLADLQKDKSFKASLGLWQKAVVSQKAALDAMMALIATAKAQDADLAKLHDGTEPLSKASGKGTAEKKEADALLAALKKHRADLKMVVGYEGKMKPGDKFYAIQSKNILEKMLSSEPKGATSDADLPKLLEEKLFKRNAAKVAALNRAVQQAHKKGMATASGDLKTGQTQLKVGQMKLEQLKKLVNDYQRARNKCATDLKTAPDSKKLIATLDLFERSLTQSDARMKDLESEIKKLAAAV